MPDETSFRDLLRRVRAGDPEATRELAQRYEPDIRRAANRPLNDLHLRNLLDSMDICQAVLAEFFVRAADGQFELTEPDELLRLFVTMARNQVLDESRTTKPLAATIAANVPTCRSIAWAALPTTSRRPAVSSRRAS